MSAPRAGTWLAVALGSVIGATGACLSPSLEQESIDSLGPETGRPGPRHRPGQPCLWCHGAGAPSEASVAVVAGTVYRRPGDPMGADDVTVTITDANKTVFAVRTNLAGNFMVRLDEGLSAPFEDNEGILFVPTAPTFPLRVEIAAGASQAKMRSVIHREGSCNACHGETTSATSAGRIVLEP
jgi:cytochrome c553